MAKSKVAALREAIEGDLLDQLDRAGTVGRYYMDLVSDYMGLWDTKNQLIQDIKMRGVTVEVVTQAGTNIKKNDSVGELVKVNAQMLKLLSELGVTPAPVEVADDGL